MIAATTIKAKQLQTRNRAAAGFIRIDRGDARRSATLPLLKSAVWCPFVPQGRCAAVRSCMEKQKELLKTLRMGGSNAVTAFVENCVSIHEAGGGDAVSKWIAVALPELPEPERAALVTLLMDSLLTDYDVEFESYPSNKLH